MESFIEYRTLSTREDLYRLTDLLTLHEIPFRIDDSENRYELSTLSADLFEKGIRVLIRECDLEKADKLTVAHENDLPITDHYMYGLSDNDIIDAVVNPGEWTEEEHLLAKQIMKQRGLVPTAAQIKRSRTDSVNSKNEEVNKRDKLISSGASWFFFVALMSFLNLLVILGGGNFHFMMGLGITDLMLGVGLRVHQTTGINFLWMVYAMVLLVTALFVCIWWYSKREHKVAYLIGIILYTLDALLILANHQWLSFAFHVFVLLMLGSGYHALYTKGKATAAQK